MTKYAPLLQILYHKTKSAAKKILFSKTVGKKQLNEPRKLFENQHHTSLRDYCWCMADEKDITK